MTDPGPETDDRHPADVVTGMVDHVLDLAATWPRWDGRPVEMPVEGEPGDLAAFTSDDLDEARSRLRRLALIWDGAGAAGARRGASAVLVKPPLKRIPSDAPGRTPPVPASLLPASASARSPASGP